MRDFQRPNIEAMEGYTWGEQPLDADTIKLNTNENPFPPSPAVDAAIAAIGGAALRRYPQPTADALRDVIAAHHDLRREHVVITHGGDEALRLALTTFVSPGAVFGMAQPSYSLYPVLAAIQDAVVCQVPLTPDWCLPDDFAARLNAQSAALTCVVNPHAPSGTLMPLEELDRLASELHGLLLIDEAYADFIDPQVGYDSAPLTTRHDNVLILRTFSKGYSLAGLRLGYLLGAPSLIDPVVTKTRDSYNIDHISQQLGLAAFTDQTYASSTWARVRAERTRLGNQLAQLGLHAPPSQSNFLLVSVPPPHSAADLYQALKARGILVRFFSDLPDRLRITIGTADECQRLLDALTDLLT